MSSILTGEGTGESENSPMEAITNATINAMAEAGVNADHMNTIMIGMAKVEFDGEKYVAKIEISVLDHDIEQEEIYHEKAEEVQERRELQDDMAGAFFATAGGFGGQMAFDRADDLDNYFAGNLNESGAGQTMQFGGEDGNNIMVFGTSEATETIRQEATQEKMDAKLAHEQNDAPGLEPGGSSSSGYKDEAA